MHISQRRLTSYRVAKTVWINNGNVEKLKKRTELMTGLTLEGNFSEPLQIANYGIGGHYEPHYDVDTEVSLLFQYCMHVTQSKTFKLLHNCFESNLLIN